MHPLERLAFPTRVAKRAQYEAFEFTLTDGGILVRNGSHANPSEHEYLVTVDDGLPTACECPADDKYEGACKHRVAIAIRRPLLDAATVATDTQSVAADGGRISSATADTTSVESSDDERATSDDDCSECLGEFPCWECVRTGRKELPD